MKKINLTKAQDERALELCHEKLFIDGLCGNLINPEPPVIEGKTYLDRLLESGMNVQSITVAAPGADFNTVLKEMYAYYNLFDYYPDKVMQIKSVEDIEEAHKSNKLGVIFSLQNTKAIGSDFYKWSIMKRLGLKICQLTYNEPSLMGSGCMCDQDNGLTFVGKQAIREMGRQGIVLDLSHVGSKTSLEAIEYSEKPMIFSHSNCFTVTPTTTRNLKDEVIDALAKKNGVIGLSSHGFMCHHTVGAQPKLEEYMDHFVYLADRIGTDHIGIGSDVYEYYTKFYWETKTKLLYNSPWFFETVFNEDLKRVDQYINIIRGLVYIGMTDEDIEKIMGKNFLRVFKEVWI